MNVAAIHCIWMAGLLTALVGSSPVHAQSFQSDAYSVYGRVADTSGQPLQYADVLISSADTPQFETGYVVGTPVAQTNRKGAYRIEGLAEGIYAVTAFYAGKEIVTLPVEIVGADVELDFELADLENELGEITIGAANQGAFGMTRLRPLERAAIYEGKKNEVVMVEEMPANLATNNSRQIYAKVAGLNIWESDGAGVQLGIGGRGLSPNRNSNFNTRQNGYDISADALGYPESYYTPPAMALERIEIIRGAASLQYGTQFGGVLNLVFKEGPEDKPLEVTSLQTLGSFGLFNSFNSLGGTVGRVNYYAFYQHKNSQGWRPNEKLRHHNAYAAARIAVTENWTIKPEFTYMTYLAQQPGGLTDAQFAADPRQSNRERNWFEVDWNLFSLTSDFRFSSKTN